MRWRNSLSNRAFSMAMTAWAAKFCDQRDLLVGEGLNFLADMIKSRRRLRLSLSIGIAAIVRYPPSLTALTR